MKLIVNCETGESIERQLTVAEKKQQEKDEANWKTREAEKAAKEAARKAIIDKLGLTDSEFAELFG